MLNKIIESSFQKIEKGKDPPYFETFDQIKNLEGISEDQYMDLEDILMDLVCEVSEYWYKQGFLMAVKLSAEFNGNLTDEDLQNQ